MPENDGYKPNDAMSNAARRGLELRKENGGKGGTAVGVARARDIANKKNLSLSTVKRMNSFFSRHKGNEKASPGKDRNKDKGYIAFLLWGGAPGRTWAKRIVERADKSENDMTNKIEKVFCLESIDISVGEIDREKGVIYGAKVIEEGPLNDNRPYEVDEVTLEQVVDYGNKPNKGIKVRLTHPDGDSMGLHLGRAKDFRLDGSTVRTDIHFANAAAISPKGDIANYVMTLAEEDSESLGMSVATILDRSAMIELSDDDGIAPLRFSHLYAVDVVSEPAATRGGLFSKSDEESEMSEEQTAVEAVEEVVELAQEQIEDQVVVETLEKSVDHAEYVEVFGNQGAMWFLEGKSLNECYREALSAANDKIAELESQVESLTLEQEEQGAPVSGEQQPAEPSVELSEEQMRAHEQQLRERDDLKRGIRPDMARAASALASLK
jgi:hypothetical protein